MYKINRSTNNIEKLEKKLFRELKIKERDHLQEWIAKNPEILGEDLLIIQKEYNGFNDTNERLDLLAVDKNGGLVIIENKLDDTGRDVVWQAQKYASYCSTLTTNQIIRIYQEYLDRVQSDLDAKQNLLDFLEISDDELLLNRNDQRIIFVANNYRKEVTSTVLWLLKHDLKIKCFRATPYAMGEDMFLQVEQIIPLPETAEFMIDAQEKEKEENAKSKTVEASEVRLTKFWILLKNKLKDKNLDYLERISANPYYNLGFTRNSGYFNFCIGRHGFRIELYFSNDPNKEIIGAMAKFQHEIEQSFDGLIEWEPLEGKRASRIKFEMPKELRNNLEGKFSDELYWNDLVDWYADAMHKFYTVLNPYLERIK